MPPQTINDETLNNSIVDDDLLLYWDKSAGVQRKVERSSLLGSVARTGSANDFTANQSITKATPQLLLTSTGTSIGQISIAANDNGNSIGSRIILDRNSNASTPAAGHVRMVDAGGTAYHVWPDDTGVLRINTATPTNANDTSGTVVGAQTSHESYKTLLAGETPIADVLARLAAASAHVRRFEYVPDAMAVQGETYEGLVLREEAPETHHYGTDKSEAGYSAGKSLNLINLCGDLLRAVVHLHERVATLEAQQGGA